MRCNWQGFLFIFLMVFNSSVFVSCGKIGAPEIVDEGESLPSSISRSLDPSNNVTQNFSTVPENAAVSMSFNDSDIAAGEISGNVVISKAANEIDVSTYNLYWGKSNTKKLSPIPIKSISSLNTLLTHTIPSGTIVPVGATHLLVYTANDSGEMPAGISTAIIDVGAPLNAATSIAFTDTDLDGGELQGSVSITAAADESDVTHYALYWGSSSNSKKSLVPINKFAANGGNHTHTFSANTSIPNGASYLLVFTQNDGAEMSTGQNVMIIDLGVPTNTSGSLTFTDFDLDGGELSGTLNINKANNETDITHYGLYWGSSSSTKQSVTPIANIAVTGANLSYTFSPNSAIPAGATHFLVFTKNTDGEMASGVSLLIGDKEVPTNAATSLSFNDTDANGGELEGDVLISKAGDESDLTHYVLYWGSNASTKQSATPITELAKTGSNVTHSFADNTTIPAGATHLLVYTKNADGEMASNANVAIDDYGLPEIAAGGLSFTDTDKNGNEIGGQLNITKASDETNITHYVVYWGSNATTKQSVTPISNVAVTGSNVSHTFAVNTALPAGATHFLVFTKNDDGEMATGISLAIVDDSSFVPDITPNAVNWTNWYLENTNESNSVTISGINQTITLSVTKVDTLQPSSLAVIVNGSYVIAGSSFTFDVNNGDTIKFASSPYGSCAAGSVTVRNWSDGSVVLDTFNYSQQDYSLCP